MNGDQKLNFRCHLNELDNGVAIPLGMTKFVEGTTSGTIARQLIMGNPYNCKEAQKIGFVNNIYDGVEELEK